MQRCADRRQLYAGFSRLLKNDECPVFFISCHFPEKKMEMKNVRKWVSTGISTAGNYLSTLRGFSLGLGGLAAVWCGVGGEGLGEPGFHCGEGGVGGPVGELVRVGFQIVEFLKVVAVADEPVARI